MINSDLLSFIVLSDLSVDSLFIFGQKFVFLGKILRTYSKTSKCRQNGAPSGLEKRGLDARIAFTTKQENQQKERNEKKSICRNGCPQRNDSNREFNEQNEGFS
ncbi:hypothetical protein, partial [Leptospira kirschneri]|uniref:hypothetical protein n=1 Tax=Leptospira kirschneri TaxID=29507 RepID=UPI0005183EE8